MSKITIRPNPQVSEVFDLLEKYLDFCREYGYRYSENDINNFRSYAWQQFTKFTAGKNFKNQWNEDLKKLEGLS
jgi:hypothetical protein